MNLPNKLSMMRICLVPLIMFFYLATCIPYGKFVAVVLFIGAALTDLYDGKIARSRGLVTDLGKLLDPIADKMLITCSLFVIVLDGAIAHPWGIIALTVMFTRDTIINAIRQVAATKGVVVAAVWSGKIKAILAYTYIPMFMFISQGVFANTGYAVCDIINTVLTVIAYVVMGAGTLVTAWSAIDYSLKNKFVFMPQKDAGDKTQENNTDETETTSEVVETTAQKLDDDIENDIASVDNETENSLETEQNESEDLAPKNDETTQDKEAETSK